MSRTLYITTELPYFPGQGGLMALNMRHLANIGTIGVVGPRYNHQPEDSLQILRDTVTHSYWWPEHPVPGTVCETELKWRRSHGWLLRLPKFGRKWLLERLTGLWRHPREALEWRAVLNKLAPKILESLLEERWSTVLLAQSSSAAWFPFLPHSLARCIYLHDIRSDYLQRTPGKIAQKQLRRLKREEKLSVNQVQAVAVVSILDEQRAHKLLNPDAPLAVVPICVDLDYYACLPQENGAGPIALFTGHLSHPPNIDAILFLIEAIWPKVRAKQPNAQLRVVGLQPAQTVIQAIERTPGAKLIPNAPDIRPYFKESAVFVVPMRYGGGVRQKIIEACAMGRPIVTTTLGAEGLDDFSAGTLFIENSPQSFADKIVELLNRPLNSAQLLETRAAMAKLHSPAIACPPLARQLNVAAKRSQKAGPRILVDMRWLEPGKSGGVEQMTHELFRELANFDREYSYRFWGTREACLRWSFPSRFKFERFATDGREARWREWRDTASQVLTDSLSLPALTSRELRALETYTRMDFTLVHGVHGVVHPDLRRFPSVVTVHDLQHVHFPEFFIPEDIATREYEYRESCTRASHVICVSEYTRQEFHRHYGIPLEKMTTIWNLPSKFPDESRKSTRSRRALARMGIDRPFIFYPAQPWNHKNHAKLLEAWSLAAAKLQNRYLLVLTGQPFPHNHPAKHLLGQLVDPSSIRHVGYRSIDEIAALYINADAMVFPSLFEGFGMPVVEAMQHRCPVICGAHSSLPEISGGAALTVDVSSANEIAEGIVKLLESPSLRAELGEKGIANARRFDRRVLAEKVRSIYAEAHERHFS